MRKDRTQRFASEGVASAERLAPLRERLEACSLLLCAVIGDVAAKMARARTAHEAYLDFQPRWAPESEWPALRERCCSSAVRLAGSSKIGRSVEELRLLRAALRQIEEQLEQLART